MTPKEKAEELVKKMRLGWLHTGSYSMGKQCALIAVNEILKAIVEQGDSAFYLDNVKYWLEVKQDIEKL